MPNKRKRTKKEKEDMNPASTSTLTEAENLLQWKIKDEPVDDVQYGESSKSGEDFLSNNKSIDQQQEKMEDELVLEAEMKLEVKDEPLEVEYYSNSPTTEEDDEDSDENPDESSEDSEANYQEFLDFYNGTSTKMPWDYDPEYTKEELEEIERREAEDLALRPWCDCGFCKPTQLEDRKVCCKGNPAIKNLFVGTQIKPDRCLAQQDFFKNFILNDTYCFKI